MKPLKDTFLIKPDNDGTELSIIGLDGQPLVISKRFNPLEHSPQYGEILELPIEFSKNVSEDIKNLKIGDKIFFHYLICEEINEINLDGIQFYFCHFGQIWGKVENEKLLPLGDVLFCEKIMDENLYK